MLEVDSAAADNVGCVLRSTDDVQATADDKVIGASPLE